MERCALLLLGGGRLPLEAVLKPPVDEPEVLHAAGASSLATTALAAPVEHALAGRRVAAGRADTLLDVVGRLATAHAQRVRLVVALSERLRTLRHGAVCARRAR